MTAFLPSFTAVLETSARVSVLIVLLWLARPLLRRRLGHGAAAALWLALAVRLLLPLPLALPWHFSTPLSFTDPVASLLTTEPASVRVSVSDGTSPAAASSSGTREREVRPPHGRPSILLRVCALVWVGGVLAAFAWLARGAGQVRRWAARTVPVDASTPLLWQTFHSLPFALRRGVTLHLTDDLAVPTFAGVFRPQIWFPHAWQARLNATELRHVLLHELGHARRRDLLAQSLCSLAACLHWFNPLVWLLARQARADRELACDAWVLSRLATPPGEDGASAAAEYGHTLLNVAGGAYAPPGHHPRGAPVVAMAADRGNLGLRVREIGAYRPRPAWRRQLALGMAVPVVALGTLAQAPGEDARSTPTPTSSSGPAPTADSSPSPPPYSVLTAAPPAPLGAGPFQIEIEAKFVEVSASALTEMARPSAHGRLPATLLDRLAALATVTGQAAGGPPTRFLLSQILTDEQMPEFVRMMNQQKGVDLLSAPRVTTKSDQKATVEFIREFIYPVKVSRTLTTDGKPVGTPTKFDKKNTGLTSAVTPSVEPGQYLIDLEISWQLVTFEGFVQRDGGPAPAGKSPDDRHPVFSTQMIDTGVTLKHGETLLVGNPGHDPGAWQYFQEQVMRREAAKRETPPGWTTQPPEAAVLLTLITAHLVDPATFPHHAASNSGSRAPAGSGPTPSSIIPTHPEAEGQPGPDALERRLAAAVPVPGQPGHYTLPEGSDSVPYAVPVPNKPGFVISPWAPDAGYVDVRGYKPGDQVPDPYTHKVFLVP